MDLWLEWFEVINIVLPNLLNGVHKIYSFYIPVIHAAMEEATEIRLITLILKGMQTLEDSTENEDTLHSPHRVVCFSQRMLCVLDP